METLDKQALMHVGVAVAAIGLLGLGLIFVAQYVAALVGS